MGVCDNRFVPHSFVGERMRYSFTSYTHYTLTHILYCMKCIDLHEDMASSTGYPDLRAQTDVMQLAGAGVKLVVATGFTVPGERLDEVIIRDCAYYAALCAQYPEWRMVRTREDVVTVLHDPGAHGFLFHIEGLPDFVGGEETLERWYAAGLRSVGLVWNDDNPLGGGTNSSAGLTALGRACVAWCEAREVLIDLAHANPVMFADCMREVTRPPYISHGGLHSLVPHKRNYTDEQLKNLALRGGIMGVFLAKSTMAVRDDFTVLDSALHIQAAVSVMGEDAVSIGTDFGGVQSGLPTGLETVSQLPVLWEACRSVGLTENQIEKIAYRNASRYLGENMPKVEV